MMLLSLNNNLCRAFCGAKSATDTFFIINFCNVVCKGDCIFRAIFGTESATDTAGVAIDLDSLAAVVIYTLNPVFRGGRNNLNKMLWASLDTFAARNAKFFLNNSFAVYKANGSVVANLGAIAVADTAEAA